MTFEGSLIAASMSLFSTYSDQVQRIVNCFATSCPGWAQGPPVCRSESFRATGAARIGPEGQLG